MDKCTKCGKEFHPGARHYSNEGKVICWLCACKEAQNEQREL